MKQMNSITNGFKTHAIRHGLQLICVVGVLLAIAIPASATFLTINNPDFENPTLTDGIWNTSIQGWTIDGSGGAGVWNPSVSQSSELFVDGVPSKPNVAWSNGSEIIQELSDTVKEGYRYTLNVYIGGRPTLSGNQYAVILAGDSELGTPATGSNQVNEWTKVELAFTVPFGNGNIGSPLKIKLWNYDGGQLNFDSVSLDERRVLTCEGFLSPFDKALSLKAKDNRAIPVKMRLRDLSGLVFTDTNITTPPVVNVSFGTGESPPISPEDGLVPSGLSDDGNSFRYDPLGGVWVINLATKQSKTPGIYTVTVKPGDASYAVDGCSQTFTRQ